MRIQCFRLIHILVHALPQNLSIPQRPDMVRGNEEPSHYNTNTHDAPHPFYTRTHQHFADLYRRDSEANVREDKCPPVEMEGHASKFEKAGHDGDGEEPGCKGVDEDGHDGS